jgi:hypothetical protein
MVAAVGFAAASRTTQKNDPPADNGVDVVLGDATDTGAPTTSAAASASLAASPSSTPVPSTTPTSDQTPPAIGQAVSQYSGIWTEYWCSSGPRRSQIQIPIADPTDAVESLQVVIRYVLRRGDSQETYPLGEVRLTPSGDPVTITFGPYLGPNGAYASINSVDMTVTVTDPAGNSSTRTFSNFVTLSECKQG